MRLATLCHPTGRRYDRRMQRALLVVATTGSLLFAACSSSVEPTSGSGTGSTSGSGGAPTRGGGGDATTTATSTATSTSTSSGTGGAPAGLVVSPQSPTLVVTLPLSGQSVPFECLDVATSQPIAGASWSLDTTALGGIDAAGVFVPNGASTGSVEVTCALGALSASTSIKLAIHATDENGVPPATQTTLKGPPAGPEPGWSVVYPYDQTVFPRGIPVPEVHLTPGSAPGTSYAIHILTTDFEYDGFFGPSNPTRLTMSQPAWDALTLSARGQTVQLEIAKLVGGQKVGPILQHWTLADGSLHGLVYYTTYDSPLAGLNGAVMRVAGGSATPEVLLGNCTVCHSASSDGSTLAAANHSGGAGVFDLSSGNPSPPLVWDDPELGTFAALYPDGGSVLVTQGLPGPAFPPNTAGSSGVATASLRTKTGTIVPSSGIEGYYAQTPSFSHDGSRLAFTDRSPTQVGGYWPGVLATLSFDLAALAFSSYDVLGVPPPGRQYSWPTFTADGRFVIFQDGVGEDLATWNTGNQGNTGRLFAVDLATKQLTALMQLNGDGYMPQGARDENKNYEPSVSPVVSGGYSWVVFTSRRTYGNRLTGSPDQTKRIWVAAVDADMPSGIDRSHPAFFLAGQELESGNHRAVLVPAACKPLAAACESGDQCCDGYCDAGACAGPSGQCSDEFERCDAPGDCCDAAMACINRRCARPGP